MRRLGHKIPKKKFYIGIIVSLFILACLMMPFWYVQDIEVEQNTYYTKEEIIKAADIEKIHLQDLSLKRARQRILTLPYISQVKLSYAFPGKIKITVVENQPFVEVEFMGTYLMLNEKGQVICQLPKQSGERPLVKGLKFNGFKQGETLPLEDEEKWHQLVEIMEYLDKYDYTKKVDVIDVYDLKEIHLYVDNLDVIMGDIGDFGKKIMGLIETHKVYDMGQLDMSAFAKTGYAYLEPIE